MGGLYPPAKPKTPAPVIVEPPKPVESDADISSQAAEERKRRQKAAGRGSNITSSLADAIPDSQASVFRSTLLGG